MGVNDSMQVMKDEIFGPLLPIMVYDEISEVINYINKNDHPLGLYYFGNTKQEQEKVIKIPVQVGLPLMMQCFI